MRVMRISNFRTFVLLIFISQSLYAETLIIRRSHDKMREYEITKLEIKEDGIHIEGERDIPVDKVATCFIPLDKYLEIPRYASADCDTCKDDDYQKKYFFDMFKNRRGNIVITCDKPKDDVVGFQFSGSTIVNGEGSYLYSGVAFDIVNYNESSAFHIPQEESSELEKTLEDLGKSLFYLLID